MADVVIRRAEVEAAVQGIGPSKVVRILGKRVVGLHRQPVTEPLFDVELEAVVVRIIVRRD